MHMIRCPSRRRLLVAAGTALCLIAPAFAQTQGPAYPTQPVKRVPIHVDDDRLLGGLDLSATLARGVAVSSAGLLAEAEGGAIVLPMAERMSDSTAGRIAGVIDGGGSFVIVALDDGIEAEEQPPAALMERMAFWIDLAGDREEGSTFDEFRTSGLGDDEVLRILAGTAAALGVDSAPRPTTLFTE